MNLEQNLESPKPRHPELDQIIHRGAMRIQREIADDNFRVTPQTLEKIQAITEKLNNGKATIVTADDLLLKAITIIVGDNGILPENLRPAYIKLLEKRIEKKLETGENLHQILKEIGMEMKKDAIEIGDDWSKIEKKFNQ